MDITMAWKTSCKDVATCVPSFALHIIFCLGLGRGGQLPPSNDAPVPGFYFIADRDWSIIPTCRRIYIAVQKWTVESVHRRCCVLSDRASSNLLYFYCSLLTRTDATLRQTFVLLFNVGLSQLLNCIVYKGWVAPVGGRRRCSVRRWRYFVSTRRVVVVL